MSSSLDWRRLRQRRQMSIRELERQTGINRGRLSNIERGLPASPAEAELLLAALRPDKPVPGEPASA